MASMGASPSCARRRSAAGPTSPVRRGASTTKVVFAALHASKLFRRMKMLDDGSVPCSIFFGKKIFPKIRSRIFTAELTGILDGSQTNGATHHHLRQGWEAPLGGQRRYSDFKRLAG